MEWKREWKPLAVIIAVFVSCYYLPIGTDRFDNALTEALHLQHGTGPTAPRGVFLVNFAPDRTPAVALAHSLRDAGVRAARDCIRRPLEQSAAHAREQGFRWVAVLTEQGTAAPLRLLDLTTGGEHPVAHDQLVATLTAEES